MKHLPFLVVLVIGSIALLGCDDDNVVVKPCTTPYALVTFESDTPGAWARTVRLDVAEPFNPGQEVPYTSRLDPGDYDITFHAPGYGWYTTRRTLSAGDVETIYVRLIPE